MKTCNIICCFIILFSYLEISWAQNIFVYPSAKEIEITVKTMVSFQGNEYTYEYELTSLLVSQQEVETFDVLHEGFISNLIAPVGWGGESGRGVSRASWWARNSVSQISPGNSLAGFAYQSIGLPSIQDFLSSGWIPIPVLQTEPDSIIGDSIFENSKIGKTIAPRPAPVPFDASTFLDSLISYTSQSLALGWISDQPTADKYEGHFSTAQTQLQQQDTTAARSELQTVLQEVEQDSGSVLSSEAYALLHFNTEYLLDQLPVTVITVDIDIKPGSDPNSINPKSKGVIPVAVLTDQNFDATMVDVSTVVFGPAGAQPVHNGHIEDVDGDGDDDLMLHFNTQDTGIQCGDTEATLSGNTIGGEAIEGSDSINTVGCK